MSVVNYQCPNCSAGLSFDSKTQKMVCEFCDSSFTVEELEKIKEQELREAAEEKSGHWEGFSPEQWQEGDMAGMKVWNCPSCGAELIAEETTGAMKCPYCDNPMVMPEQFDGLYRPDFVIPFKKSKKDALETLKKHYLNKPLLPRVFKEENHLEEVKGMYVPFWLYDLKASGRFTYEGIHTRIYEDSKYRYTENSIFHITRKGSMEFQKIPVDGSERIDDTMMESIEPFAYEEMEPFQLSYLSGYAADKYDMEPDELTDRVHTRVKSSMQEMFLETVKGYDEVRTKQADMRISEKGDVKYGLFPVWFLNTRWNGQQYTFLMNGQTGRMTGDLPVGRDLLVQYWLKRHIPLTLILTAGAVILRLLGVM